MGAKHINERPTSSFKDGVLVVPGYNFDAVSPRQLSNEVALKFPDVSKTDLWEDVGVSSLYIAAGVCLKGRANILTHSDI